MAFPIVLGWLHDAFQLDCRTCVAAYPKFGRYCNSGLRYKITVFRRGNPGKFGGFALLRNRRRAGSQGIYCKKSHFQHSIFFSSLCDSNAKEWCCTPSTKVGHRNYTVSVATCELPQVHPLASAHLLLRCFLSRTPRGAGASTAPQCITNAIRCTLNEHQCLSGITSIQNYSVIFMLVRPLCP